MLITLNELMQHFDWNRACEIKGLNPCCLSEGTDPEENRHFTIEEYKQLIGKKKIKSDEY